MPKFPKVKGLLKGCEFPLMVYLDKSEVASSRTKLRAFTDGNITLVSNRHSLYSPIDGTKLNVIESGATEVSGDSFNDLNNLVSMTCSECHETAGVDADMAFQISGNDICCPNCGKATQLHYGDENADDVTGDEDLEDMSDVEDVDDDEDEDEEDEDTTDDDEDEDSEVAASLEDVMAMSFSGDMDADTPTFEALEDFILDDSNSEADRIAALTKLLNDGMGESGEYGPSDLEDFVDQANSYAEGDDEDEGSDDESEDESEEMASNEVYFSVQLAKRLREHAEDEEFQVDPSHKKMFDKSNGAVAFFGAGGDGESADNSEPEWTGKLLKVLKNDTVLVETQDGKKMTVKYTDASSGDGVTNLTGTAQETANEGDIVPAENVAPQPNATDENNDPNADPAAPKDVNEIDPEAKKQAEDEVKRLEKEEQDKTDARLEEEKRAEAEKQKAETIEVDANSLTDEQASVRLTALQADNSEVAAFVGDTHVGTLRKAYASEKAAALFAQGPKLSSAFRAVFNLHRKNMKSPELAAFGFKPVEFTIGVGELFQKRLEKEVAAIRETAATETASSIENFATVLELAAIGLNKGVFGKDNPLAKEIAGLLARNNHANPELEARKLLATASHPFVKAVIEQAKALAKEDEGYLRGITHTIATAEFMGGSETPAKPVLPTPPKRSETASLDILSTPETASGNRYAGIVGRLGRRR